MTERCPTATARRTVLALLAAAALLAGCARKTETVAPATSAPDTTAAPETTRPGTTVRRTTTPRRTTPDVDLGGIDPALFAELPDGASYRGWKTVNDVTDSVKIDVPEEWEADGQERVIEGNDVPSIYASADQDAYDANRSVAGLRIFRYPPALSAKGLDWALDRQAERDRTAECTGEPETFDVAGQGFRGTAVVTVGCGDDNGMAVVHLAATDLPGVGDLVVIQTQLVRRRDVEVLQRAIRTFAVTRTAPTTTTAATIITTTAPAPPVTRNETADYDRAVRLVEAHVHSCGMGSDWTSANGSGGLWTVTIWIVPPGPVGENGDPGAGEYFVDVDAGRVVSTNGTANVLCPG